MPFDNPVSYRLDRMLVWPIQWLWRPYLARGEPALLDGDPGAGRPPLTADLAARGLRPGAGAGKAAPRRGRRVRAEGGPRIRAVVRSGLAARRRTTPMRVRPTDPRRALCRPYDLGERRIRSADGTSGDRNRSFKALKLTSVRSMTNVPPARSAKQPSASRMHRYMLLACRSTPQ